MANFIHTELDGAVITGFTLLKAVNTLPTRPYRFVSLQVFIYPDRIVDNAAYVGQLKKQLLGATDPTRFNAKLKAKLVDLLRHNTITIRELPDHKVRFDVTPGPFKVSVVFKPQETEVEEAARLRAHRTHEQEMLEARPNNRKKEWSEERKMKLRESLIAYKAGKPKPVKKPWVFAPKNPLKRTNKQERAERHERFEHIFQTCGLDKASWNFAPRLADLFECSYMTTARWVIKHHPEVWKFDKMKREKKTPE